MPPIAPSAGPTSPPIEYAAKIRLMQMYSCPGQRSSVSKVTAIQSPPEPMPMTNRAGK
jgi:hypothetical protein